MNKLKKIFTAPGFAAAIFAAGAAGAADMTDPAPMIDDGQAALNQILSSDESVLIISEDFAGQMNNFTLLCPNYGSMRELYTKDPHQAVLSVRYHNRDAMAQSLVNDFTFAAYAAERGWDMWGYHPTHNYGLIAADGTVQAAGNIDNMIALQEEFLKQPDPLPGAKTDDKAAIQRLRSFADNYCFGRG